MRLLIVCAVMLTSPIRAEDAPAPVVPQFLEETSTAGLDGRFAGEWQYMVGGGATTFDCNGDALPDVLTAGGVNKARFYLNKSTVGGALAFSPHDSGLELEAVTGAYALDVDSDGITDLVLLRVGENVVMRGLGDCRFERANEAWGFDGGDAWSTAFAATWEKGAIWPTLAVGNYIDRTQTAFPWGSCTPNWLHRPQAAGKGFAPPLPLKPSFCALSMLFTDWNRSGTPALRISNDREYYKGGQEQLWHLEPGADPVAYTPKEGWQRLRVWGMGIASLDLDFDGYPEYFLTSMADSKLQTLAPPVEGVVVPKYVDVAFPKGAIAQRPYTGGDIRPSTGWHAQFEDVNNDGFADLFVAKGNVSEMPDFAMLDPNNLLLQRADGTFEEAGDRAGVASMEVARGAALADFNRDGWMDLLVVNRNAPPQVWRNTGRVTAGGMTAHWLALALQQPAPNTGAIGAWVEVKVGDGPVQRREVTVGGGHAGGSLGWQHFGLGTAEAASVRVIWPDGTEGSWQQVAADGFYTADRGAGTIAVRP